MSEPIKKEQIAEEGVLDNLLKPLSELIALTEQSDEQLQSTAESIKKSFNFSETAKGLSDLDDQYKKTIKLQKEKKQVTDDQSKAQKALEAAQQKIIELETKEGKALIKTKAELAAKTKEVRDAIKAEIDLEKATSAEVGTLERLEAQNRALRQERKQLNLETLEGRNRLLAINSTLNENNKFIKENADEMKKQRLNVGNYASAIDELDRKVKGGGMSFRDLRKVIQEYQSVAVQAGRTSPIGAKAIQEAAKLQDELDTLTKSTKALADDGANLKASLQLGEVVAGSYQSVMAAQQLMGVESERVLEVMAKIQALQVIMNNLSKIRVALDKASTLTLKGKIVVDKIYNATLGRQVVATKGATVAQKGLNLAMKAFPLIAIIAGIVALIANFEKLKNLISSTTREQEISNEVSAKSVEIAADEMNALDKLKKVINDENISREDKNKAVEKLQKEYPHLLDNIDAENSSIEELNKAIELNSKLVMLNAEVKALAELRSQAYQKILKAEIDLQTGQNQSMVASAIGIFDETTAKKIATVESKMLQKELKEELGIIDELTTERELSIKALMEEIEAIGNNTKSTDENTRAVRDNNKAREKQLKLIGDINDLLEEQNKKALKELDDIQKEEISQTEKHLKKLHQKRLTAIVDAEREGSLKEDEARSQRLIAELEYLNQRKNLLENYGVDVTEIELKIAESKLKISNDANKKIVINEKEKNEEVKNETLELVKSIGDAYMNMYDSIQNRQMEALKEQQALIGQQITTLQSLASAGSLTAKDSITELMELQDEQLRKQEEIARKQRAITAFKQFASIFEKELERTDNPTSAIAKTSAMVAQLQASMPTFYYGTEDTGKGGGLDSKGGFLAKLHPNERVVDAKNNAPLLKAGITNPMLPELALRGLQADRAGNSYDLIRLEKKLDSVVHAIENQPSFIPELQKTLAGTIKLITTEKSKGITKVNRHRYE